MLLTQDFFFASFVTCLDIKASLHRAFQTWQDMHPFLHFVDVTEECRQVYGKVESNCSLVELFITNRNNSGIIKEDGHEKPFPNGGAGYPWGDPYAVCNYDGATDCTSDKSTNRRQLTEMTGAPAESASSLTCAGSEPSALVNLRSTTAPAVSTAGTGAVASLVAAIATTASATLFSSTVIGAFSLLGWLQKTWNAAFDGGGKRVASSLPLIT